MPRCGWFKSWIEAHWIYPLPGRLQASYWASVGGNHSSPNQPGLNLNCKDHKFARVMSRPNEFFFLFFFSTATTYTTVITTTDKIFVSTRLLFNQDKENHLFFEPDKDQCGMLDKTIIPNCKRKEK